MQAGCGEGGRYGSRERFRARSWPAEGRVPDRALVRRASRRTASSFSHLTRLGVVAGAGALVALAIVWLAS